MKRSPLVLLALVVAVGLAAAFAGVGRPEAAHGSTQAPGTVTTVGHGVVTLTPDKATVTAGVHTQAATAADALSRNSRLMNQVIAALKQGGAQDIQTQQVSLYPQTDDNGNVTGFSADDTVSATTAISGAGDLIDAAVAAGANTVSGPTLSITDQASAYRNALQKAYADARAKADALAKAGGFAVGAVASVTESSSAPVPIVQPMAVAGKAADSTPVEPGTQDTTADVTVTFRVR
jgi:uncharacterized protein YggE